MKRGLLIKIMSCILSAFIINSTISINWVSANNEINGEEINELGLLPTPDPESDEYKEYLSQYSESSNNIEIPSSNANISTCCDLSETSYFPQIGHQKGGSCASWSTTYYQFTYEANKLNNINTKEHAETAYSPVYTFSFLNGGENVGSYNYQAYNLLKEHGALRLSDCSLNNNLYSWSTNTEAMIEALNTRVKNDHEATVNVFNATESLNEIKHLLYGTNGTDGKILAINTTHFYGWKYKKATNPETNKSEWIATHSVETTDKDAHAMTVVGYNDDIWCDFNDNGIVDDGECGAFKVANSHGENYRNSGYIWVAYDALNKSSLIDGWESDSEKRKPIFSHMRYNENSFYWIEVENKEVEYVGQLTIDTDYRNSLSVYAGRNDLTSTTISNSIQKFEPFGKSSKEISHKGTLVFDYAELAEPISDYISGYNWFVKLNGNHNRASFKITDNLSNTIVDFGDIDTGDSYKPISLSMGDLNYDGVNDVKDSKILFNAVYRDGKLSNLQEYLASNMNSKFPINAAVTPSEFDDIGSVLNGINVGNINWDTVPASVDLQTLIDGNYDVLFINCSSNADVDGEVIREFVEQGGTVYASDWALDSIEEAFPERNISHAVMSPQSITGSITDKGLLTSIGVNNIPIEFDKASWRLVTSELQDDVTVYVEGKVTGALSKSYPLAFSFPYGDNGGKVFCTSFHQSANSSAEMNEFMNDLVLTINHNKDINAISEWSKENGYKNVMPVTAALNSAEESASYSLNNIDTTSDFAILANESGDVSIKLTAPDGSTYTNFENGEFVNGDIETTDSEMQVYSMGKRGLSVSAPMAADNGEWSFRIVSNVSYRSSFAAAAAEKSKELNTDNYTVDYKVASDWGSGQNIQVTITNTGDEPLRNWALQCDNFHGMVTNVWNGMLHGESIIRNAMYNSDIAPGASVTLGYTLTNADGEVPVMKLCNFRKAKQEGYSVDIDVLSEWGSGFIGAITITNTTDEPIMAWELSFNTENFDISGTNQFVILENTDNYYKITGTYNGNIPIPANTSITMQFNGEKTSTPSLTDISLTEMTF